MFHVLIFELPNEQFDVNNFIHQPFPIKIVWNVMFEDHFLVIFEQEKDDDIGSVHVISDKERVHGELINLVNALFL